MLPRKEQRCNVVVFEDRSRGLSAKEIEKPVVLIKFEKWILS